MKKLGEYKNRPIVSGNNRRHKSELTEKQLVELLGGSNNNENTGGNGEGITPSRPKWTGHADAEGLRAIGWTDEDIAYYQEHGVNWNAEDDEYHKVSEDNKALYGVLTVDNISTYTDRIVYLPKIDFPSNRYSWDQLFNGCKSMVAIPSLVTPATITTMGRMFMSCHSLVSIPPLDTSNVTDMSSMFGSCNSLVSIPPLDTSKVTDMSSMFGSCNSLVSIPPLDTSKVTSMNSMFSNCYSLANIPLLDTANVTSMNSMFGYCYSLANIPLLDTANVTSIRNMFRDCNSLTIANLKNVKLAYDLSIATKLSKDSLLYLINNEAATSAITIMLASYAYTRLAEDADIVAALANHPNISLAK